MAASGPVIVVIDDVQWLDVPSARVLAFVVRRLEDAPIRILVAPSVGSGGDPLGLGQAGPAPSLSCGPGNPTSSTGRLARRFGHFPRRGSATTCRIPTGRMAPTTAWRRCRPVAERVWLQTTIHPADHLTAVDWYLAAASV
jgi:hypothetical protein